MSKDYKQSNKKPANAGTKRSGGSGSSWFGGMFIGLCLGAVIAVGVAFYMNKMPNPFGGKTTPPAIAAKPVEPVKTEMMAPPGAVKGSQPSTNTGAPSAASGKPATDRFDFYTMLPELGGDQKAAQNAKPAEATAPATVQPAKGSYLQVGAFQNETDADNLKAKLALLGVEANIQTSEVSGKGVMHRVRVGPLASAEDIDRVRAQLRVNGIEPALIKQ